MNPCKPGQSELSLSESAFNHLRRVAGVSRQRTAIMKTNILIIEHDDLIRGLLEEWLGEAGYRVTHASACETASVDAADLVIVDIFMPKSGCQEAIAKVNRTLPAAAVIAISAQFRAGLGCSDEIARQLRVRKVLPKPFSRADLLAAVNDAIGPAKGGAVATG